MMNPSAIAGDHQTLPHIRPQLSGGDGGGRIDDGGPVALDAVAERMLEEQDAPGIVSAASRIQPGSRLRQALRAASTIPATQKANTSGVTRPNWPAINSAMKRSGVAGMPVAHSASLPGESWSSRDRRSTAPPARRPRCTIARPATAGRRNQCCGDGVISTQR